MKQKLCFRVECPLLHHVSSLNSITSFNASSGLSSQIMDMITDIRMYVTVCKSTVISFMCPQTSWKMKECMIINVRTCDYTATYYLTLQRWSYELICYKLLSTRATNLLIPKKYILHVCYTTLYFNKHSTHTIAPTDARFSREFLVEKYIIYL